VSASPGAAQACAISYSACPAPTSKPAGVSWPTSLQSALVCPLVFNERFNRHDLGVSHRAVDLHRRSPPASSTRISEQAAAVIYNSMVFEQTQEDS